MKKQNLLFLVAILVGTVMVVFSRVAFLDLLPSGFNWDEAAYAYNAFSILETGKDEWGKPLPFLLQSFGDFKPAFLSYWLVPWFSFFGMSKVVAKLALLPISLLGLSGVFLLSRSVTKNRWKALFITGLIGLSPWHIHYSRALMDPIIGFSFFYLGWGLIFQKRRWTSVVGMSMLLLSMYTYNAQRVLVPVTWFGLVVFELYAKKKSQLLNKWLWAFGGILISILFTMLLFSSASSRAKSVFIFSQPIYQNVQNEITYRTALSSTTPLHRLHQKELNYLTDFLDQYAQHLQPDFLFFGKTLGSRHSFSQAGLLFVGLFPLIVMGLVYQLKRIKKISSLSSSEVLTWIILLTTPVISALTTDVPHSGRVLALIFPLVVLAYYGMEWLASIYAQKVWQYAVILCMGAMILLSFVLYSHKLYLFFPEDSYVSWQGEMQQIAAFVDANQEQNIYLDLEDNPGIFLAFYNHIDPTVVQASQNRNEDAITRIKNVHFDSLDSVGIRCFAEKPDQILVTGYDENSDFYGNLQLIETIDSFNRYHEVKPLYAIYKTGTLEGNLGCEL